MALVSRHLPRLATLITERFHFYHSRRGVIRPATTGGLAKCEWRACVQAESCQHEAMKVHHSRSSRPARDIGISGCRTPA